MNIKYTPSEVAAILSGASVQNDASIARGNAGGSQSVRPIIIDLSIERNASNPFKVSFPFVSLYVEAVSDAETFVNIAPETQDTYQGSVRLKAQDSLDFDLAKSSAYITHPAQAGKFMKIIFFVDAHFKSGSQLIDVNSVQNSINVAKSTVDNRFPIVHLGNFIFNGSTPILPNEMVISPLVNLNGENSPFSLAPPLNVFKVPDGFEFIIKNCEVNTAKAITGVGTGYICVGSVSDSFTGPFTPDNVFKNFRVMRSITKVDNTLRTVDGNFQEANTFRNYDDSGYSGTTVYDTGAGDIVFDEGDEILCALWARNAQLDPADTFTIDIGIDVIGELRPKISA